MLRKLFSLFKKKEPEVEHDQEADIQWHEKKAEYLDSILGEAYEMVLHAIVPFEIGGGLDFYYFPNGIPGTGLATLELVDRHGNGPSNRVFPAYELVMFTKHKMNIDEAGKENTPFGKADQNLKGILNGIARYSMEATLNPDETCEFPEEMDGVGGKCLILDAYSPTDEPGPGGMGIMLLIEVFRSEMDFARENSGADLIQMLKKAGHYPYSDLDREPVV
jgi:hypothetical protein